MILGIGIDLVDIARLEKVMERHQGRAHSRLFTPAEIDYCTAAGRPGQSFAARFAAKEAVMKALGADGIALAFRDIEVLREATGAPTIVLHGRVAERARSLGAGRILVSLTHAEPLALASVVVERGPA